jgi:hypothetical protein
MTAREFGDVLQQMIQNRYFINDNMTIWLEMIHGGVDGRTAQLREAAVDSIWSVKARHGDA